MWPRKLDSDSDAAQVAISAKQANLRCRALSGSEFQLTAIILLLGGALVAVLGSGFAVSRHLDV